MNDMIRSWKEESRVRKLQYGCVLLALLVELIFFSPPALENGAAWLLVNYFLVVPCGLFLLLTLLRGINRKGRASLVLGLVMLVWAVVAEGIRLISGMGLIEPGVIAFYYALALPMAFALDDSRRQWGITALAVVFVLEGIRLCLQTAGLALGILPEIYAKFICWDGARLLQMFHPTTCAMLLMLGMGCSLALCLRTKKIWLRVLLIALAAAQFGVQTLTNGRNAVGFTCLMLGGMLFCLIRGTGWKRAPLALAAAVALAGLLFVTSQKLFKVHEQHMIQAAIRSAQTAEAAWDEQEETQEQQTDAWEEEQLQPPPIGEDGKLATENVQKSLRQDLFSFNGRTDIWKEAVRGVGRHPSILLYGTDSVARVLAEDGKTSAEHTHNSYLETLCTLGLPGLLLGLAITLLALRAGVILLWKNEDLWQSSVAIMTLCVLGCSLLEPYLFAAKSYHHYLCVFFLTGVGYLHQWCAEMKSCA